MPFDSTDIGGLGGSLNSGLIGQGNSSGDLNTGSISSTQIDSSGQPVNTQNQQATLNFLNIINRSLSGFGALFSSNKIYNADTYKSDVIDLGKSIGLKGAINYISFQLGELGSAALSIGSSIINAIASSFGARQSNQGQTSNNSSVLLIVAVMAIFGILALILLPLSKSKD